MLALAQRRVVGGFSARSMPRKSVTVTASDEQVPGQQRAGGHRTRPSRAGRRRLRALSRARRRRAEPAQNTKARRARASRGRAGSQHALAPGPASSTTATGGRPLSPPSRRAPRCDQALCRRAPATRRVTGARLVVRQHARASDAVDGSRRRARDHVDRHAQGPPCARAQSGRNTPRRSHASRPRPPDTWPGACFSSGPFDAVVGARGARRLSSSRLMPCWYPRARRHRTAHQCEPQFLPSSPPSRARPRAGPRKGLQTRTGARRHQAPSVDARRSGGDRAARFAYTSGAPTKRENRTDVHRYPDNAESIGRTRSCA